MVQWLTGPRGGKYQITKSGKKMYASQHRKSKEYSICWKGYKRVPGTKPHAKGSCKKIKSSGYTCSKGNKKFVKRVSGKCIRFGDPNMKIKKHDPARKKAFCARHRCTQKHDPATPGYQSCKKWNCKTG